MSTSTTGTWRSILRTAQHLEKLMKSQLPETGCQNTTQVALSIPPCLPAPTSIISDLRCLGLPEPVSVALSEKYDAIALQLRLATQDCLASVLSKTSVTCRSDLHSLEVMQSKIFMAYKSRYEGTLHEWAVSYVNSARAMMPQPSCRGKNQTCSDNSKEIKQNPSFNFEYTPFLEEYFKHNAYPSPADRALLAKKSMMSNRQIEVWFQNHRSRARKEGKILKRMRATDPLSSHLLLESLEEKMSGFIRPESERTGDMDSDDSGVPYSDEEDSVPPSKPSNSPDAPNVLNATASADTPIPAYKPSCEDSLFFANVKFYFPEPVWPRISATSPADRRPISSGDFDEFIVLFAKLTVREGLKKPRRRHVPPPGNPTTTGRTSTPSLKPDRSAATCSITTILPTAPHPALIRLKISLRVTPPSPLPTVRRTPRSRPHAFRTPSPQSRLATLVPPSQPASDGRNLPGQRKVARLPRRTPGSTSVAHRGISPASSDASPSPSHSFSPHSRTSSFGSDSSSQTRMSSNSSCSSTSTLTTPLFTPSTLPETFPSPSSMSTGFNFNSQNLQNIEDLFGDSSLGALSPVEGLQLNFPSGGAFSDGSTKKQTFDFSFAAPHAAYTVRAQS